MYKRQSILSACAAYSDKIDEHNRRVGFHPPGVPRWDGAPPGPVRRLLDTFQPVRGLCFGAYAETSPAVDKLLKAVAEHASARTWRELGARCAKEAKAHYVSSLRRNLGVSAMRENARLVLYRVEALSAPLGACTGGLADRTEWQRRQYVRSADRGGLRRSLGALCLPRRLPGVEEHFAFCACRDGLGLSLIHI